MNRRILEEKEVPEVRGKEGFSLRIACAQPTQLAILLTHPQLIKILKSFK